MCNFLRPTRAFHRRSVRACCVQYGLNNSAGVNAVGTLALYKEIEALQPYGDFDIEAYLTRV